jgi:hypothetical protein
VPVIVAVTGHMSAGAAGGAIGKTAGSLLMLSFFSWLFTRNRGVVAKANARIIVGFLLIGTCASEVIPAYEAESGSQRFLKSVAQFQAKKIAVFKDLDNRFNAIDVPSLLTAEGLTSKKGQDAARVEIAKFSALLAERRRLVAVNMLEGEQVIRDSAPASMRQSALSSFASSKAETLQLYEALDATQSNFLEVAGEVVDFTAAEGNRLNAAAGEFVFSSDEQRAKLVTLSQKLVKAEDANAAVIRNAAAAIEKSRLRDIELNKLVK